MSPCSRGWKRCLCLALVLTSAIACRPQRLPTANAASELSAQPNGDQDQRRPLWRGAPRTVPIRWRLDYFANQFWIIDQLSRWDDRQTCSGFEDAWQARRSLSTEDRDSLGRYADLRRQLSRSPEPAASRPAPFNLFSPPPSRSEQVAIAFFESESVAEVATALNLSTEQIEVLDSVFARFRERADELLWASAFLATGRRNLETMSEATSFDGFVSALARFIGAPTTPRAELVVQILWSPPSCSRATQYGRNMIIPLSEEVVTDERELQSWLGVAAHEFCHYYISSLSSETRQEISRRVLAQVGVPNILHPNIIDEATCTVLGNMVFMEDAFPARPRDNLLYNFEPANDYPYAIDSLARSLAPAARRHFAVLNGFSRSFLTEALRNHEILFPARPSHFARVTRVWTEDRTLARYFRGLFPGIDRSIETDTPPRRWLQADDSDASGVSRWVVSTRAGLDRFEPTSLAGFERLSQALSSAEAAACLVATRRAPSGAYDLIAVGATHDDIRRLLIRAHQSIELPTNNPLCMSANGLGNRE